VELFQQFASVGFVLLLAGLAAWWLRKGAAGAGLRSWARGNQLKRMQLLQRLPLTPQHYLCVVRVDGKDWIVGVYPSGMTVLDQVPIPTGIAASERTGETT
jgi:flagellar biogenesis protein FliO